MLCTVPGCATQAYAVGLCMRHYTRKRRHGDPTKGRRSSPGAVKYIRDDLVVATWKDAG